MKFESLVQLEDMLTDYALQMENTIRYHEKYQCKVSPGQCGRAKDKVFDDLEGGLKEHYARLSDYQAEILETNSRSTVKMVVETIPNGEAVKDVFPSAEHMKCTRHIHANFIKKLRGLQSKILFWAAAKSISKQWFEMHMEELKTSSKGTMKLFQALTTYLNKGVKKNAYVVKIQEQMCTCRSWQFSSIPCVHTITHHKMLSPIKKSPGFILSKNAAFIMEEASKIIEQSPQSICTGRLPSSRSTSVPLRIRDLKEKMEAAHRTSRLPEPSPRPKTCPSEIVVLKNKNKSATPGKTSIQKFKGSTSRNSRSTMKQKEHDVKSVSAQLDKEQRSTPKRVQSRSGKTPEVLKPNNQKQNTASRKDHTNSKPRVPYQHGRKTTSTSSCKEVKKSRKAVENSPPKPRLVTSESVSTTKNISGKRQTNGDATRSVVIKDKERSVKCNITIDGPSNWDRNSGMDVVSFTFTSPIKKPEIDSEASGQPAVKSRSLFQEDKEIAPVIDSDALSVLLEQKLKELSSLVEDKIIVQHDSDVSLVDQMMDARMDSQGVEVTDRSENYESGIKHEHQHEHACTSASPEPSLSNDSCITSNSTTTLTSNGNTQYMSATRNMELFAEELELLDLANFMSKWSAQRELEYIKEILNHAELVLDDLDFDPTQVISVDLCDQLESQHKCIGPLSKQQRKTLFDCVRVCLEDMHARGLSGSYDEWSKWSTVFEKKGLLADEIQKQIRGWRSMEELMVDEVVDRDMSSGDGKWMDFKAEGFEEGAVIGTDILTVLIDEIVVDFLS
ncbi:uncharacterized protein LOC143591710 [Bidens hawaiensis]|uniref:uncharacterized protein LOC143591710 n=1 Tax=Bidens hawaiensis TaxID=980011 RepID=UPI00404AE8EA